MKLLLIDGNSVLFRAYYATCYGNMMKTSFGVYTNAVYAFSNMIDKAITLIKPDYCVVAFDKGKHTFRHEIAEDYKGGRKPAPDELVPQFQLVRDFLDASNIRFLEYDDIEADDIIGSLAKKYDFETCIFSSDHDLLQLIDDSTSVYMMKKGMSDIVCYNEKQLFEDYQLKPFQIIEFKGLAGDSSDNIHGVDGIGEKTAVKLLNDYNSCEGIYENIDAIKGKLQEKLISGKESCFISKRLATIKTDFIIDEELESFRFNINYDTRNDFLKKYEMFSLVKNVNNSKKNVSEPILIKEVDHISSVMYEKPYIHFLTNDFSYYERKIIGVSFTNEKGSEYISFENIKKDTDTLSFIASKDKKCVYDLKQIYHTADFNGIEINGADDVLLMAYLVNNNNNDFDSILRAYGYYVELTLKDLYGTEKKPLDANHEDELRYISDTSKALYNIYTKVIDEIKKYDMEYLYSSVELLLTKVLYEMEKEGIKVDNRVLKDIAERTLNRLNELEKDIYTLVGEEFNINSPKQLSDVLFHKLDLPDLKKGSTNAEILEKLRKYHPVIDKILDYRKYTKLYSSYAEGLQRFIGEDSRIHTIYSQTIVATGRLSSYDPNLQNISVRNEEGKEIRSAFVPDDGCMLVSSDYSQIELRVLASLADESKMIEAFNTGIDIHTKTAMDVFKVNKEDVTDLIRRHAKAVNFGVVYGISDFGLANQTSLSFADAKKFIDDYFITYPNIKVYLDEQVQFCKDNGYVKTILNRRRYINEINDKNFMVREFGKRAAMNSTIQGSAADIIKLAMLKVSKAIKDKNLKSKMLLQVHDELIFNVPLDEMDIMNKLIKECMSSAYTMKANLDVSFASGKNWMESK